MGKRVVSVVVKDVVGGRADLGLQLPPDMSIAELKGRLCMSFSDSPAPSRQRLVCQVCASLQEERASVAVYCACLPTLLPCCASDLCVAPREELMRVAVFGSVLQCIAACCSVLQCVAVCCSYLPTLVPCHAIALLVRSVPLSKKIMCV